MDPSDLILNSFLYIFLFFIIGITMTMVLAFYLVSCFLSKDERLKKELILRLKHVWVLPLAYFIFKWIYYEIRGLKPALLPVILSLMEALTMLVGIMVYQIFRGCISLFRIMIKKN